MEPSFVRSFVSGTSSDDLAPDVCDTFVGEILKVPAPVWREMFEWLLRYDDIAELERITAPTLMIWGDADALVGRDVQALLEERIHSAELLVYRGIGHTPRWEDPSRFASDVAAFVERSTTTPP